MNKTTQSPCSHGADTLVGKLDIQHFMTQVVISLQTTISAVGRSRTISESPDLGFPKERISELSSEAGLETNQRNGGKERV